MKKALILVLLVNLICVVKADEATRNKLKTQLRLSNGILKAQVLNKLAEDYLKDSINISFFYANQAREIAIKYKSISEEADALSSISKYYKIKDQYANSLKTCEQLLELRKRTGNQKHISQVYNNIGLIYYSIGQFSNALNNYKQAYKIKKVINDSIGIGITLNNIANVYFKIGDYNNAIQNYQEALDIFYKAQYMPGLSGSLNGCGLVFENLMNYSKAIEFYLKALEISDKINNKAQSANILNNLGNVYSKNDNYKKSIDFYNKGLKKRIEINDQPGIASSLNNIGLIYKSKNEYLKAIGYFTKALEINKKLKNKYEICLNLNAIGKSYLGLKEYNKALESVSQSLQIARLINNTLMIQQNYMVLSSIYSAFTQYEKALDYYKKAMDLRDTIENIELKKKINELQTKYETERKEQANQILSKQNEIQKLQISKNKAYLAGLLLLMVVLLFTGYIVIRQNKIKLEHKAMVSEQKLLRSQINPHFIFNSLTSIQSYIFEDDKLLAGKYISDFASLMRLILENSREEFITLEKEIKTLSYYTELQKLRYENKFDYFISTDPNIDPDFIKIPPMLGQPFVENAIKHGIIPKEQKGTISIRFLQGENQIIFEIEDDGIGREKSQSIKSNLDGNHKSLALSITKERLYIFNKRNRKKISFEIIDLYDNEHPRGTLVRFKIPIT